MFGPRKKKSAPLSFISNMVRSWLPSYANWATLRKETLRRWIRSWEAGGGTKESIRHKHRYSDEQKQVAVEHYLNHGCCLAFTSRALGYPCTDVLACWG